MKFKTAILILLMVIFTILFILPAKTHSAQAEIPGILLAPPGQLVRCICPAKTFSCLCVLVDMETRD